ncbi:nucleotide-binding universal stress UspA family protein [Cellulophaga sp. RHA19]|uniref:universal stress protein n=1 Tax=Cellulophaga sp. RHA19 TaxID=1798237 RepID=UPI000C2B83AC|nr:universal stress protein [Cellulophaga sp. RHA19]PKB44194.1 nucleotide-binding universal stress UspA family protein [Cellulophaga sp. RHA19]
MKKKILLPTDFSANSNNAIHYAIKLYKEEQCEFFILHSCYVPGYAKSNLLSLNNVDQTLAAAKEAAAEKMEELKKQPSFNVTNTNHTFKYLIKIGDLTDNLKETIKSNNIALVVMGTRGETDSKHLILGSNAVVTMEKVRACPVLAIPGHIAYKAPSEIVFPTSFKTTYTKAELATLVEIASLTNAPIRVLYIQKNLDFSNKQIENKALLNTILKPTTFTHHKLYSQNLHNGVRSFVQSRDSGLIAFVNKKHNFFGSIFSNPMVKDLGNNTNVPILALHNLIN